MSSVALALKFALPVLLFNARTLFPLILNKPTSPGLDIEVLSHSEIAETLLWFPNTEPFL